MIDNLKLAVISDVHLGHSRNKASSIIEALDKAFPDNAETGELHILFLAGDIFDRLLNLPNDDVVEIDLWIARLLTMCSKRDIAVRVLEGTPSHDHFQSKRFETILKLLKIPVNFNYARTLSIEYMAEFDISVLYVPDEWRSTTDKTLAEVKDLLLAKGLEKVDFAIMHGQFDYQLPAHIKKIPRHDSASYLAMVNHYIFIGHVHNFSTFDRIVAQGSFDRLSHGEEGPKGHVRATITDTSQECFFIENKLARTYNTVNCKNRTLEDSLSFIRKKVDPLRELSCVRISAEVNHPIFSNMNQLVTMFPTIVWTKDPKTEELEKEIETEDEPIHNAITINKENVIDLLMARVQKSYTNPDVLKRSEQLLKQTI